MSVEEFQSLTFGTKINAIAELTGYSESTVRRWLTGEFPIPFLVQQFFRLRRNGVIGKEWENWSFGSDGLLYHPFWRRGFTGHELAGMWFDIQMGQTLRSENRRLTNQLEDYSNKPDEQEKLIFFYRSQVQAEAKLGLSMMRILA